MSKYFSDARAAANENFNSMNGSDYMNANGGSSAGLGGATSQPYILNIANGAAPVLSNVVVGGAYTNLQATNFGNVAAVAITMGIASLTYGEFLYQTMNKPFVVGATYLSSATTSQVLETLTIAQKDINGNESSKVIVPTIDPYQQQTDKVVIAFNWKFDGFTSVTISQLLANATLKMYLYPAENVSTGRALTGGSVVRGFSNPDIVKKDKVEILGGGGSMGANGRRFRG
tara:strand:+ start:914 stop:1603 length:690 start_codon:yes stop_codon:yes gene_type:complete